MKKTQPPVRNPVAVLREEFDDWAVLFNPDTAQAVGINPVGVAVWKWIDGKRTIEDVVRLIEQQYEEVPESVQEEVFSFVEDLTEGGFVGYKVEMN
jgi:SynChlorMet cassette protein ScmD